MRLTLEGFPTMKVSESIELPSVPELFRNPMYIIADAEDVYKYGGELNRRLLELTPITHTKRYVTVYTNLQYLRPNVIPTPSAEWHCDGVNSPYFSDDLFHILMNDSSLCQTQFLAEPIDLEVDEDYVKGLYHQPFRKYLDQQAGLLGFQAKEIEPNRMYTWTCRHPHRAQEPVREEFRFFWKVSESDLHAPRPYEKALRHNSTVAMGTDGKQILNIEQGPRGIILHI